MRRSVIYRWGRFASLPTRCYSDSVYNNASPTRLFSAGTLHYPEAPSRDQHHDLASYVAYAERTGLDVESNVFIGTHFEYSVASALRPLGFDLRRVGGQSDQGIDLLGTWSLPSCPPNLPLRVLLQCKAYSTAKAAKVGPQFIRELEGAYLGAPSGWRGSGVVGLLVTQRPATKGIREALARSRWPLGYVSCSKDGTLEQMLWNRRAEEEGLEGMGINARLSDEDRHGETQRLVLTWKGRPYTPTYQGTSSNCTELKQIATADAKAAERSEGSESKKWQQNV
ncbi:hypothetical protein F5Y19DRAFT_312114 [Xylariaceae sp. FL1651]|nr:hypothetical protein F5Y19DRAFT_312114 [Xylariaceae sp. FL1651]